MGLVAGKLLLSKSVICSSGSPTSLSESIAGSINSVCEAFLQCRPSLGLLAADEDRQY